MHQRYPRTIAALASLVLLGLTGAAADEAPQVKAQHVRDGVYMLTGSGGNIGVVIGDKEVFLIDDQYSPATPAIRAAVDKLTPRPIRFVLNTHYHQDHTGGNENFGRAGALLVAQTNVRHRLAKGGTIAAFDRTIPPAPPAALPVITFDESIRFHLGNEEIEVVHVPPAHTDGDSVVWLRRANVVHTGDVVFNGMYPFIDGSGGGRIEGVIAAVDRILSATDEETLFIPGHGPLARRADLVAYRDMLAAVDDALKALRRAGKTVDEAVAAKPTRSFDATWGKGFFTPDQWVRIMYLLEEGP